MGLPITEQHRETFEGLRDRLGLPVRLGPLRDDGLLEVLDEEGDVFAVVGPNGGWMIFDWGDYESLMAAIRAHKRRN